MAKIVFCEDDPTIRKLIGIAMRSTPHDVLLAEDGTLGLGLIRHERPDLVCTDLSMPGLDGFQLLETLSADEGLAHIPVILITASTTRTTLEEGIRRGAASVLVKPFSTADLRARVEMVLNDHRTPDPIPVAT